MIEQEGRKLSFKEEIRENWKYYLIVASQKAFLITVGVIIGTIFGYGLGHSAGLATGFNNGFHEGYLQGWVDGIANYIEQWTP